MNSTVKFISIVVEMLKPAFYFSSRGVSLIKRINKGDKIVNQYGSFEPTLDPSYTSLDNTFEQIPTNCNIYDAFNGPFLAVGFCS